MPISSKLHHKKCLVLGAGGFIGTNLCLALKAGGANVIGYGRNPRFANVLKDIEFTRGNLNETAKLAKLIPGTHYVFHLLGDSSPGNSSLNPQLAIDTVKASLELLDLCKANNVQKIIFASSGGAVYGKPSILPIPENMNCEPINSYGINMLMVEKYLALYNHIHGLNYTILRIANPYGRYQLNFKNQGIIAAILENALKGQDIEIWGNGNVVRDFIHIDDVIEAFLSVASYQGQQHLFNVGSGVGRSINNVVSDIETTLNKGSINKVYKAGRKIDIPENYLNINLIKAELNWQPKVTWIDGLANTSEWMQNYLTTTLNVL